MFILLLFWLRQLIHPVADATQAVKRCKSPQAIFACLLVSQLVHFAHSMVNLQDKKNPVFCLLPAVYGIHTERSLIKTKHFVSESCEKRIFFCFCIWLIFNTMILCFSDGSITKKELERLIKVQTSNHTED
jgi:hypothetical protein